MAVVRIEYLNCLELHRTEAGCKLTACVGFAHIGACHSVMANCGTSYVPIDCKGV